MKNEEYFVLFCVAKAESAHKVFVNNENSAPPIVPETRNFKIRLCSSSADW